MPTNLVLRKPHSKLKHDLDCALILWGRLLAAEQSYNQPTNRHLPKFWNLGGLIQATQQEEIIMLLTVLEAHVGSEKAAILEAAYKQAVQQLDAGIVETFLLHETREPDRWQIITFWESREALEAMRQSGETPRGVVIFNLVGAEPGLTVFEVAASAKI
jgi:hypothetical protein